MLLLLKNHLEKTKVNVTAQNPDLNPTENLWSELKTDIRARRPSNVEELERFLKKEWTGIPLETCERLVENSTVLNCTCNKNRKRHK